MISVNDINNFEQTIERKDRIIEVLKKAVRQWVKEYNILDEIIEMYKMSENEAKEIIAELEYKNKLLKNTIKNKKLGLLAEENEKLKQTLQEIKEIIKDCDNGKCFTCKYNKEDAENCVDNRHNEILGLITKAEEE